MKFSVRRKINLANIDKDIYPFETEDVEISDSDTFEEAISELNRRVSERIGYHKAFAESKKSTPRSYDTIAPSITGPSTTIPQSQSVHDDGTPDEFKID